MNSDAKIARIKEFYDDFLNNTEVFDQRLARGKITLGVEIAYLLAAVAKDSVIDVWPHTSSLLMYIKERKFAQSHPIWKYLRIMKE